jgi:hypothetical protein
MNEVFALVILGVILITGAIVLDQVMPPIETIHRTGTRHQRNGSAWNGCSAILAVLLVIGLVIALFDGDSSST